jgi:hypothetical protein
METFTIREAAERCEVSYQAMRRRVDRGSLQAVHKDGVRRIPRTELERAGLWPGAVSGTPEEVQRLQAENEGLRRELRELRLLPQQVDAEREARERVEQTLYQERAEKQTALAERESVAAEKSAVETELREAEQARAEAEARAKAEADVAAELREQERRLAQAGFFERRRLLRDLRARGVSPK